MNQIFNCQVAEQEAVYREALNCNLAPLIAYLKQNQVTTFAPYKKNIHTWPADGLPVGSDWEFAEPLPASVWQKIFIACPKLTRVALAGGRCIGWGESFGLDNGFLAQFEQLTQLEALAVSMTNDELDKLLSHTNKKIKMLYLKNVPSHWDEPFDMKRLKPFSQLKRLAIRLDADQPNQQLNALLSALPPEMEALSVENHTAKEAYLNDFSKLKQLAVKHLTLQLYRCFAPGQVGLASVANLLDNLHQQTTHLTIDGHFEWEQGGLQPHHFVRKQSSIKVLTLHNIWVHSDQLSALMRKIAGSKLTRLDLMDQNLSFLENSPKRLKNYVKDIFKDDLEIILKNLPDTQLTHITLPEALADAVTVDKIRAVLAEHKVRYHVALKGYVYQTMSNVITNVNHHLEATHKFSMGFLQNLSPQVKMWITGPVDQTDTMGVQPTLYSDLFNCIGQYYAGNLQPDRSYRKAFNATFKANFERLQKDSDHKVNGTGIKKVVNKFCGLFAQQEAAANVPSEAEKRSMLIKALFQTLKAVDETGEFEALNKRMPSSTSEQVLIKKYLMVSEDINEADLPANPVLPYHSNHRAMRVSPDVGLVSNPSEKDVQSDTHQLEETKRLKSS